MIPFEYNQTSASEVERLGRDFYKQNGDDPRGLIAEAEYDRLFDHLAEALRRHGTFIEGSGEADFSGYRYVDQIPWISIVPSDTVEPRAAAAAALEAVSTSHRSLAVSFDFPRDALLILPPNRVYTTFDQATFEKAP